MIENLFSMGFLYRVGRDAWTFISGKRRTLTNAEVTQLRQKWKPEFEAKIRELQKNGYRTDVIVRDMKRIDDYPDVEEQSKGISSWFKVGLLGTYHRGVQVGLNWGKLTEDSKAGEWRFTNRKFGEEGELKVILMGFIPYENIETVDWEGDEYYPLPHIYCYFDAKKKEPYEKLAFCEKRTLDEWTYYSEIAEYENVRKFSKKHGIEYFS